MLMAFIYFVMGLLFLNIAIHSASETIWNATTIVLAIIVTLNFGVGIRLIGTHFRIKKNNKHE